MYSSGLPTLVHTLVTLRGRPVVGALVLLNLVPTNASDNAVSASVTMLDDGRADPDLVAGDGIYSAYIFNHVGPTNIEVEVSEGHHPRSTIIILICRSATEVGQLTQQAAPACWSANLLKWPSRSVAEAMYQLPSTGWTTRAGSNERWRGPTWSASLSRGLWAGWATSRWRWRATR